MRSTLRLFAGVWLAAMAGYLYAYPLVADAPQDGPPKGGPYVSPQGAPLGALVARSGRNSARQSTIELLRALGAQE